MAPISNERLNCEAFRGHSSYQNLHRDALNNCGLSSSEVLTSKLRSRIPMCSEDSIRISNHRSRMPVFSENYICHKTLRNSPEHKLMLDGQPAIVSSSSHQDTTPETHNAGKISLQIDLNEPCLFESTSKAHNIDNVISKKMLNNKIHQGKRKQQHKRRIIPTIEENQCIEFPLHSTTSSIDQNNCRKKKFNMFTFAFEKLKISKYRRKKMSRSQTYESLESVD